MDKELIKSEFIEEVHKVIRSFPKQGDPLLDLQRKTAEYSDFETKLVDILNEVLEKNGIDLQEGKEQDDFLEFMQPTIENLIQQYTLS